MDATLNVLVAARAAGVRRVVYAGSSSVYGDTPTLPKHEQMLPDPITPYAVAKLAGEHYMRAFTRVYGLETVTLRYFNVFGPYQDPTSHYSGVLAIFCRKMLAGEQPTIYGDGEQSRDFTYIDNVVEANLLAAAAPGGKGLGPDDEPGHRRARSRSTRPSRFSADLTGYQRQTGLCRAALRRHSPLPGRHSPGQGTARLRAQVDFREGLRRTVEWYRSVAVSLQARVRMALLRCQSRNVMQ